MHGVPVNDRFLTQSNKAGKVKSDTHPTTSYLHSLKVGGGFSR